MSVLPGIWLWRFMRGNLSAASPNALSATNQVAAGLTSSIAEILEVAWESICNNLDKETFVRPYWSEADLVHAFARSCEEELRKAGMTNTAIHLSSSLRPELFEGELQEGITKLGRWIMPDMILDSKGDASSRFVACVEVKTRFGRNPPWKKEWIGGRNGVTNDLTRLDKMKGAVCEDVAAAIVYDPNYGPNKTEVVELESLLDSWRGKIQILKYIRV